MAVCAKGLKLLLHNGLLHIKMMIIKDEHSKMVLLKEVSDDNYKAPSSALLYRASFFQMFSHFACL